MADLISASVLGLCSACHQPVNDPLSVASRLLFSSFARDRFGFLNRYSPLRIADIKDNVPMVDSSMSIGEICDLRATELIAEGKPITVCWSGGVDSTALLVAFLKNGIKPEMLAIRHSEASIRENPVFYSQLEKLGAELMLTNNIATELDEVTEGYIITGWGADQLFGSDVNLRNSSWYNMPWVTGMREALRASGMHFSDKSIDTLSFVYGSYANTLGLHLEQFCEFIWLLNFGIKWTYVTDVFKLVPFKDETRERVINFFEDDRFQRWSMANFPNIRTYNVAVDQKHYKLPLKQYIYDYTKDDIYLSLKGKVASWGRNKSDASTMKYISVHDTDGYRKFQLKGTNYSDYSTLRNLVFDKYDKEE